MKSPAVRVTTLLPWVWQKQETIACKLEKRSVILQFESTYLASMPVPIISSKHPYESGLVALLHTVSNKVDSLMDKQRVAM